MDTLVHPAASQESDNREDLRRLSSYVQSYGDTRAEVRCDYNAVTARSSRLPQRLAEDAHGSHLVNFPFAFTVFLILTTGLTAVGLGIIITNAWLAAVGFVTTLVGCFLYGWSLHDD